MKLSELFLNRFLYRDSSQSSETQDSAFVSADSSTPSAPSVAAGGAAQDINTSNVFINGGQLEPGTIPQTTLDVSNWGWGQTCVFSSSSATVVAWGTGTFTSAGGDVYSISAGNTGTMAAKTYIYLDLNVSETVYQVTTTSANAVGVGKVLIAVAQNASSGNATFNLSEATQIVGDNILANSINASKIVTGQLIVGTNVGLGTAQDSSGVTTIIGNTVTTGFVNALSITAGSVAAENITGTTITGKTVQTSSSGIRTILDGTNDDIRFMNSGTLYARIYPYTFAGGGGMLAETNDGDTGAQLILQYGTSAGASLIYNGAGLFIDDNSDASFSGAIISVRSITPAANDTYYCGSSSKCWTSVYTYNIVDASGHTFDMGAGSAFRINGNSKTAIVPTSQGYKALFCVESPEVWFMDFCGEDKVLDPMFVEVTVAPYHMIKCEGNGYQVWGKRKGHETSRFDSKSKTEFIANEKFLNMNKPLSS